LDVQPKLELHLWCSIARMDAVRQRLNLYRRQGRNPWNGVEVEDLVKSTGRMSAHE